jgi:hypothetical protein
MYQSTEEPMALAGDTRHAFLNAILFAYNNHLDLQISPDDLLQCFTMVVSQHVNDNAEKYRSVFVNHEGQKDLIVISDGSTTSVWPRLLDLMSTLINRNVKTSLTLDSDFSVSNNVTRNVATIMKMATFKEYFRYGFILGCGIPAVQLLGTDEDWLRLRSKVINCTKIFNDSNPENNFANWSKHFVTVIDWLILTRKYIGTDTLPDDVQNFWARIITYIPYGSGSQKHISGWARILFPASKYGLIPDDIDFSTFDTISNDRHGLCGRSAKNQGKFGQWVAQVKDEPEGTTQVKAELNNNGLVFDIYVTAGHVGFTVSDNCVMPILGYYINARKTSKADITDLLVDRLRDIIYG